MISRVLLACSKGEIIGYVHICMMKQSLWTTHIRFEETEKKLVRRDKYCHERKRSKLQDEEEEEKKRISSSRRRCRRIVIIR